MDFKRATALFADPDFDGDPVQIYEPGPNDLPIPPDDPADPNNPEQADDILPDPFGGDGNDEHGRVTYHVDDVEVVVATERVQYLDEDERLITESLKDFTRKAVQKEYASLDAFLTQWNSSDRKHAIVQELANRGVFFDELAEQVGADLDVFDIICHVAFDRPPLTRRERAENVRKRDIFGKYEASARAVLDALLEKFADGGLNSLESLDILKVDPLTKFGTPIEIVKLFGGKEPYLAAIQYLETQIYQEVA
jgi:type I restriction enzyme R subunit